MILKYAVFEVQQYLYLLSLMIIIFNNNNCNKSKIKQVI